IMTVIILIVAPGLLGLIMVITQGSSTIGRIKAAYIQKKITGFQFVDSIMIFLGGWLLIFPGLVSGLLGLSTLLPKIRSIYWDLLVCKIVNKIIRGKFGFHIR
ncbi:MAG: FxsA family protein, partial [Peptococcaceae bacterium]|nr:FxsA family protein [Peptococcaceae bacterium]